MDYEALYDTLAVLVANAQDSGHSKITNQITGKSLDLCEVIENVSIILDIIENKQNSQI